jgi:hypothetical protein
MGMCAIYTAVAPTTVDELAAIARDNEARQYGAYRRTLGRLAVAELVAAVAPPSHTAFARRILDGDLWGFLTPAATRGNHAAALQRANPDITVPIPLWPTSVELACLVGTQPAHYIGNNLVMLQPELVASGVTALERCEMQCEPAAYLNEFLRIARSRGNAVLLHWDYR